MATSAETPAPERRPRRAIRRYSSVYVAAVTGILALLLSVLFIHGLSVELGASGFFLAYLVMVVRRLPHLTPEFLRAHADESDTPGIVILIVALGTVATASASLFILLNAGGSTDRFRLLLGIASLTLGWLALHTMLAFHYAYEYYETDDSRPKAADGSATHRAGLEFPGSDRPDALSFLYFSFVVAMTAQVSDVTVTSNSMRRLVLLHGIISFFFNTVILATAVNVVVSLGH